MIRPTGNRIKSICSGTVARFAFIGGLCAGLAAGWILLPEYLYCSYSQPMAFNHLVHTEEAGMDCDECHAFRADGSFTGIPRTETCADCHSEVQGDSAEETLLVEEYVLPEREIPWLSYSRQPQNVYFSHIAHVRLGGIECSRCHGDLGQTESLDPVEINRISTYSRKIWGPHIGGGGPESWDSMKMNDCSGCHAEHGIQDHCLMCHK